MEEIKHFVKCIKNRETPIADGNVGYRTVKMCEIVAQSSKENKRIYFN